MFFGRNEMRNEVAFCPHFLPSISDNFRAPSTPDPLAGL
jgi:hypothetical protein